MIRFEIIFNMGLILNFIAWKSNGCNKYQNKIISVLLPISYVSIKVGKFIKLAIRISLKSINGGPFIVDELS